MDLSGFKEQMKASREKVTAAGRPAAQAGAQVIYELARLNCPVSEDEHYFYGSASKAAPKGEKKAKAYGPYKPGNLKDAIYQAFQDKSPKTAPAYSISWNKSEAPYGHMVELGTSRAPSYSFIGRSMHEGRAPALAAMRSRFVEELAK